MGIVFSQAIAAALYYLRPARPRRAIPQRKEDEDKTRSRSKSNSNNFQRDALVTENAEETLLPETLLPVVDAESLADLREAVSQTIIKSLGNVDLVKVFLKDPLSNQLVDDQSCVLPSTGFINDVLSQKAKTAVTVNSSHESLRDVLANECSNENSNSVFLLPIPERGTHQSIGLILVESKSRTLSNGDSKKMELCVKQVSVTYEVIKSHMTLETCTAPANRLVSLIQLCSDLNDQDAVSLERKVVRYLQHHTRAGCGFLLLVVPETQELFCQAIGSTALQVEIRFAGRSSAFSRALETKQPMTWADIPKERRAEVEKVVGSPINNLLCVPVTVADSKELLALACMANKENQEDFSDEDIETIHQCFKYTATVLTNTLAFQNERKLKNQTQALLQVAKKLFTRLGKFLFNSPDDAPCPNHLCPMSSNLSSPGNMDSDSQCSVGMSETASSQDQLSPCEEFCARESSSFSPSALNRLPEAEKQSRLYSDDPANISIHTKEAAGYKKESVKCRSCTCEFMDVAKKLRFVFDHLRELDSLLKELRFIDLSFAVHCGNPVERGKNQRYQCDWKEKGFNLTDSMECCANVTDGSKFSKQTTQTVSLPSPGKRNESIAVKSYLRTNDKDWCTDIHSASASGINGNVDRIKKADDHSGAYDCCRHQKEDGIGEGLNEFLAHHDDKNTLKPTNCFDDSQDSDYVTMCSNQEGKRKHTIELFTYNANKDTSHHPTFDIDKETHDNQKEPYLSIYTSTAEVDTCVSEEGGGQYYNKQDELECDITETDQNSSTENSAKSKTTQVRSYKDISDSCNGGAIEKTIPRETSGDLTVSHLLTQSSHRPHGISSMIDKDMCENENVSLIPILKRSQTIQRMVEEDEYMETQAKTMTDNVKAHKSQGITKEPGDEDDKSSSSRDKCVPGDNRSPGDTEEYLIGDENCVAFIEECFIENFKGVGSNEEHLVEYDKCQDSREKCLLKYDTNQKSSEECSLLVNMNRDSSEEYLFQDKENQDNNEESFLQKDKNQDNSEEYSLQDGKRQDMSNKYFLQDDMRQVSSEEYFLQVNKSQAKSIYSLTKHDKKQENNDILPHEKKKYQACSEECVLQEEFQASTKDCLLQEFLLHNVKCQTSSKVCLVQNDSDHVASSEECLIRDGNSQQVNSEERLLQDNESQQIGSKESLLQGNMSHYASIEEYLLKDDKSHKAFSEEHLFRDDKTKQASNEEYLHRDSKSQQVSCDENLFREDKSQQANTMKCLLPDDKSQQAISEEYLFQEYKIEQASSEECLLQDDKSQQASSEECLLQDDKSPHASSEECLLQDDKSQHASSEECLLQDDKSQQVSSEECLLQDDKSQQASNEECLLQVDKSQQASSEECLLQDEKSQHASSEECILPDDKSQQPSSEEYLCLDDKIEQVSNEECLLQDDKSQHASSEECLLQDDKSQQASSEECLLEDDKSQHASSEECLLQDYKSQQASSEEYLFQDDKIEQASSEECLLLDDKSQQASSVECLLHDDKSQQASSEECLLQDDKSHQASSEELFLQDDKSQHTSSEECLLYDDKNQQASSEEYLLQDDESQQASSEEYLLQNEKSQQASSDEDSLQDDKSQQASIEEYLLQDNKSQQASSEECLLLFHDDKSQHPSSEEYLLQDDNNQQVSSEECLFQDDRNRQASSEEWLLKDDNNQETGSEDNNQQTNKEDCLLQDGSHQLASSERCLYQDGEIQEASSKEFQNEKCQSHSEQCSCNDCKNQISSEHCFLKDDKNQDTTEECLIQDKKIQASNEPYFLKDNDGHSSSSSGEFSTDDKSQAKIIDYLAEHDKSQDIGTACYIEDRKALSSIVYYHIENKLTKCNHSPHATGDILTPCITDDVVEIKSHGNTTEHVVEAEMGEGSPKHFAIVSEKTQSNDGVDHPVQDEITIGGVNSDHVVQCKNIQSGTVDDHATQYEVTQGSIDGAHTVQDKITKVDFDRFHTIHDGVTKSNIDGGHAIQHVRNQGNIDGDQSVKDEITQAAISDENVFKEETTQQNIGDDSATQNDIKKGNIDDDRMILDSSLEITTHDKMNPDHYLPSVAQCGMAFDFFESAAGFGRLQGVSLEDEPKTSDGIIQGNNLTPQVDNEIMQDVSTAIAQKSQYNKSELVFEIENKIIQSNIDDHPVQQSINSDTYTYFVKDEKNQYTIIDHSFQEDLRQVSDDEYSSEHEIILFKNDEYEYMVTQIDRGDYSVKSEMKQEKHYNCVENENNVGYINEHVNESMVYGQISEYASEDELIEANNDESVLRVDITRYTVGAMKDTVENICDEKLSERILSENISSQYPPECMYIRGLEDNLISNTGNMLSPNHHEEGSCLKLNAVYTSGNPMVQHHCNDCSNIGMMSRKATNGNENNHVECTTFFDKCIDSLAFQTKPSETEINCDISDQKIAMAGECVDTLDMQAQLGDIENKCDICDDWEDIFKEVKENESLGAQAKHGDMDVKDHVSHLYMNKFEKDVERNFGLQADPNDVEVCRNVEDQRTSTLKKCSNIFNIQATLGDKENYHVISNATESVYEEDTEDNGLFQHVGSCEENIQNLCSKSDYDDVDIYFDDCYQHQDKNLRNVQEKLNFTCSDPDNEGSHNEKAVCEHISDTFIEYLESMDNLGHVDLVRDSNTVIELVEKYSNTSEYMNSVYKIIKSVDDVPHIDEDLNISPTDTLQTGKNFNHTNLNDPTNLFGPVYNPDITTESVYHFNNTDKHTKNPYITEPVNNSWNVVEFTSVPEVLKSTCTIINYVNESFNNEDNIEQIDFSQNNDGWDDNVPNPYSEDESDEEAENKKDLTEKEKNKDIDKKKVESTHDKSGEHEDCFDLLHAEQSTASSSYMSSIHDIPDSEKVTDCNFKVHCRVHRINCDMNGTERCTSTQEVANDHLNTSVNPEVSCKSDKVTVVCEGISESNESGDRAGNLAYLDDDEHGIKHSDGCNTDVECEKTGQHSESLFETDGISGIDKFRNIVEEVAESVKGEELRAIHDDYGNTSYEEECIIKKEIKEDVGIHDDSCKDPDTYISSHGNSQYPCSLLVREYLDKHVFSDILESAVNRFSEKLQSDPSLENSCTNFRLTKELQRAEETESSIQSICTSAPSVSLYGESDVLSGEDEALDADVSSMDGSEEAPRKKRRQPIKYSILAMNRSRNFPLDIGPSGIKKSNVDNEREAVNELNRTFHKETPSTSNSLSRRSSITSVLENDVTPTSEDQDDKHSDETRTLLKSNFQSVSQAITWDDTNIKSSTPSREKDKIWERGSDQETKEEEFASMIDLSSKEDSELEAFGAHVEDIQLCKESNSTRFNNNISDAELSKRRDTFIVNLHDMDRYEKVSVETNHLNVETVITGIFKSNPTIVKDIAADTSGSAKQLTIRMFNETPQFVDQDTGRTDTDSNLRACKDRYFSFMGSSSIHNPPDNCQQKQRLISVESERYNSFIRPTLLNTDLVIPAAWQCIAKFEGHNREDIQAGINSSFTETQSKKISVNDSDSQPEEEMKDWQSSQSMLLDSHYFIDSENSDEELHEKKQQQSSKLYDSFHTPISMPSFYGVRRKLQYFKSPVTNSSIYFTPMSTDGNDQDFANETQETSITNIAPMHEWGPQHDAANIVDYKCSFSKSIEGMDIKEDDVNFMNETFSIMDKNKDSLCLSHIHENDSQEKAIISSDSDKLSSPSPYLSSTSHSIKVCSIYPEECTNTSQDREQRNSSTPESIENSTGDDCVSPPATQDTQNFITPLFLASKKRVTFRKPIADCQLSLKSIDTEDDDTLLRHKASIVEPKPLEEFQVHKVLLSKSTNIENVINLSEPYIKGGYTETCIDVHSTSHNPFLDERKDLKPSGIKDSIAGSANKDDILHCNEEPAEKSFTFAFDIDADSPRNEHGSEGLAPIEIDYDPFINIRGIRPQHGYFIDKLSVISEESEEIEDSSKESRDIEAEPAQGNNVSGDLFAVKNAALEAVIKEETIIEVPNGENENVHILSDCEVEDFEINCQENDRIRLCTLEKEKILVVSQGKYFKTRLKDNEDSVNQMREMISYVPAISQQDSGSHEIGLEEDEDPQAVSKESKIVFDYDNDKNEEMQEHAESLGTVTCESLELTRDKHEEENVNKGKNDELCPCIGKLHLEVSLCIHTECVHSSSDPIFRDHKVNDKKSSSDANDEKHSPHQLHNCSFYARTSDGSTAEGDMKSGADLNFMKCPQKVKSYSTNLPSNENQIQAETSLGNRRENDPVADCNLVEVTGHSETSTEETYTSADSFKTGFCDKYYTLSFLDEDDADKGDDNQSLVEMKDQDTKMDHDETDLFCSRLPPSKDCRGIHSFHGLDQHGTKQSLDMQIRRKKDQYALPNYDERILDNLCSYTSVDKVHRDKKKLLQDWLLSTVQYKPSDQHFNLTNQDLQRDKSIASREDRTCVVRRQGSAHLFMTQNENQDNLCWPWLNASKREDIHDNSYTAEQDILNETFIVADGSGNDVLKLSNSIGEKKSSSKHLIVKNANISSDDDDDDLDALSEAYADSMNELETLNEQPITDSSSSKSDSDILNHTSTWIRSLAELQLLQGTCRSLDLFDDSMNKEKRASYRISKTQSDLKDQTRTYVGNQHMSGVIDTDLEESAEHLPCSDNNNSCLSHYETNCKIYGGEQRSKELNASRYFKFERQRHKADIKGNCCDSICCKAEDNVGDNNNSLQIGCSPYDTYKSRIKGTFFNRDLGMPTPLHCDKGYKAYELFNRTDKLLQRKISSELVNENGVICNKLIERQNDGTKNSNFHNKQVKKIDEKHEILTTFHETMLDERVKFLEKSVCHESGNMTYGSILGCSPNKTLDSSSVWSEGNDPHNQLNECILACPSSDESSDDGDDETKGKDEDEPHRNHLQKNNSYLSVGRQTLSENCSTSLNTRRYTNLHPTKPPEVGSLNSYNFRQRWRQILFSDIIGTLPGRITADSFDDLTKLLREIMQEARNLTDAERCSVFLLDKDTDELVAMVFDGITADDKERLLNYLRTTQGAKEPVQGEIRLPKTQGIAGHVATTGTLLNIHDAYSHPLFYRGIDDSTGFRTRNILCFPIKDEEGVVLGVAQLCNKKTFQYFTTFDEDIASAFAVYCCISISHSLMYKKVIDIQYRNSLANELMMFHMQSLMYKKLQDTQHRHRIANELMLFHITQQVPSEEVESMASKHIPPVTVFNPNFDSFEFPPRTIPESMTVLSCLSMFEDLGFLSRWRIKLDTLVRFLLMVKKGYRNPPYHNWMHAYSVTHFCYLLIKNLHLQNYLEDIELLALFVSCLCHDIDHRGTTNSFQVQSQSVLAALYSSEGSVMERHHLAQSMCILNTEGSNLFEQLSSKEYQTILDLMKEIILATDLAHHLRKFNDQKALAESGKYDRNNPEDRNTLITMLMTSCDLSDQTKNWNQTKLIASLVYQEFFSQGDLEKALGKNPLEMMDRERACIPELQISFLDNIAAPVYRVLVSMFPEASIVVRNVEDNRKHWVHIGELLKLRHGNSTQAMSLDQIISIEDSEVEDTEAGNNNTESSQQVNGR